MVQLFTAVFLIVSIASCNPGMPSGVPSESSRTATAPNAFVVQLKIEPVDWPIGADGQSQSIGIIATARNLSDDSLDTGNTWPQVNVFDNREAEVEPLALERVNRHLLPDDIGKFAAGETKQLALAGSIQSVDGRLLLTVYVGAVKWTWNLPAGHYHLASTVPAAVAGTAESVEVHVRKQ